jgi:DNA-binding IclR family transcriptional regulator
MVGARLPAVLTASGTAILSKCSDEMVEDILQRDVKPLTAQSVVDPVRLKKRIKIARERGYAIIANETVLGDISVASSITDEHGHAVAGVSIAVPATRWTLERAETELVKHVQLAAASLSSAKFQAFR